MQKLIHKISTMLIYPNALPLPMLAFAHTHIHEYIQKTHIYTQVRRLHLYLIFSPIGPGIFIKRLLLFTRVFP